MFNTRFVVVRALCEDFSTNSSTSLVCPTPADTRKLIMENVFWSDLQNVFIYRVMLKAETVDISFPMRFNIEGSKQMYGWVVLWACPCVLTSLSYETSCKLDNQILFRKVTMTFQWSMQIMHEAMRHLIYVRCPQGRRIKIFLPQSELAPSLCNIT